MPGLLDRAHRRRHRRPPLAAQLAALHERPEPGMGDHGPGAAAEVPLGRLHHRARAALSLPGGRPLWRAGRDPGPGRARRASRRLRRHPRRGDPGAAHRGLPQRGDLDLLQPRGRGQPGLCQQVRRQRSRRHSRGPDLAVARAGRGAGGLHRQGRRAGLRPARLHLRVREADADPGADPGPEARRRGAHRLSRPKRGQHGRGEPARDRKPGRHLPDDAPHPGLGDHAQQVPGAVAQGRHGGAQADRGVDRRHQLDRGRHLRPAERRPRGLRHRRRRDSTRPASRCWPRT
jgi:hypothetical protein